MVPDSQLSELRERIDRQLARSIEFGPDCPTRLAEAMRYSVLAPGKRLRPLLVLWSAQACGCSDDRALPAAAAVELVHVYSLIHDDLPAMDNDDLRRGRPSCHRAFDEATAILAGDALLARALELLAGEIQPGSLAARCCAELAAAAGAEGLVGGQADDLAAADTTGNLPMLEHIHRRKTGALLVASLRLGALIAQATDEQLHQLTAYGKNLGLAFQIVDDLLDVTGSRASLGKTSRKDIEQGKLTFPALLGQEASRRHAQQLVQQAIECLQPFGDKAQPLRDMARYVLERDR